MDNALIILTEGPQDAAFIYKVLIENNFTDFSGKLDSLLTPFKEIITEHVKEKYPDNLNVKYNRMLFLPYILHSKDKKNLVLIYALQGVTDYNGIIRIFWKYLSATASSKESWIRFLIIFDADSNSQTTIDNIISECSELSEKPRKKKKIATINTVTSASIKLDFKNVAHNQVDDIKVEYSITPQYNKDVKSGFYFLPGTSPNIGTLDYLTLPLMQANKTDLFKEVKGFVESIKPEYKSISSIMEEDKRVTETAKFYKTQIGIAGQFDDESRASSNAAFYQHGLYMENQILNNDQCKDIIKLVNDLLI